MARLYTGGGPRLKPRGRLRRARAAAQGAGPAERHALVIGNGDYEELGELDNPLNDAADLARELKDLGFEVDTLVDAKLEAMESAAVRLGDRLARSKAVGRAVRRF